MRSPYSISRFRPLPFLGPTNPHVAAETQGRLRRLVAKARRERFDRKEPIDPNLLFSFVLRPAAVAAETIYPRSIPRRTVRRRDDRVRPRPRFISQIKRPPAAAEQKPFPSLHPRASVERPYEARLRTEPFFTRLPFETVERPQGGHYRATVVRARKPVERPRRPIHVSKDVIRLKPPPAPPGPAANHHFMATAQGRRLLVSARREALSVSSRRRRRYRPFRIVSGSRIGVVFAVSAVDVWNIALAELGVPTVNSTSDTTPQATKINAVWTNFRRKFLTCARWRGATITKDLSKSSTAPVADAYSNQFFLPADLLQPLSINRQELSPSNDVYKIELSSDKTQRMLLTNESEVELEYIADVVDVGVLDPQTIHAMGIALAAFVASYFGLKASEQRVLEEKAEAEIRKARTVAAKQGTPPVFGNRVLLEADEYGSGNVFPFPLDWP